MRHYLLCNDDNGCLGGSKPEKYGLKADFNYYATIYPSALSDGLIPFYPIITKKRVYVIRVRTHRIGRGKLPLAIYFYAKVTTLYGRRQICIAWTISIKARLA